jgi:glycosyltransferase involved in cell wall biosynthesis
MGGTMLKVAFVVHRYGPEVFGGAEMLCRQVAEHMNKHWDIEVLTTCAKDYISWKNEFEEGIHNINNVSVRRFKVDRERRMLFFRLYSRFAYRKSSSLQTEERWMKYQGPISSSLFQFMEKNRDNYHYFFFFTYLYCTTYFGLKILKDKAILIPTAHDEPPVYLKIFKKMFQMPKGFIFSTEEEKSFVDKLFGIDGRVCDSIGVGVTPPAIHNNFRTKFNIKEKYILYVGRIEGMKGTRELFSFFKRFKKNFKENVKLIVAGPEIQKVPNHSDILYVGILSEIDKFEAINSAELIIIPSKYESLSILALESWILKKPILVNQKSEVLLGQIRRSGGGLSYNDYPSFCQNAITLLSDPLLNKKLGEQGYEYVMKNYSWDAIENKYLNFINRMQ